MIADRDAEVFEILLGQDDPGGITDFGDLERGVRTEVMTTTGCIGKVVAENWGLLYLSPSSLTKRARCR